MSKKERGFICKADVLARREVKPLSYINFIGIIKKRNVIKI